MFQRLLIANRGEIAVRIARAAADLDIQSVAVYSEDDADALHVRLADDSRPLGGAGPRAYLEAARLVAIATETGCDAVHPGYGFLSENAGFARACADAGLVFVGPPAEVLDLFGDKGRARAIAGDAGAPVLAGMNRPVSQEEAEAFLRDLGPGGAIMIKAVAGGGGRGMRVVERLENLEAAYSRCRSEAKAAFGNDAVYVEELLSRARHIEIQIVGDGSGRVIHLGERDCTLQRRHQKIVEIAPSPWLSPVARAAIAAAAVRIGEKVDYRGVGTVEFLVDAEDRGDSPRFAFIEVNPRLQVEHTVTEAVTGLDLVAIQLQLAAGKALGDLGLRNTEISRPNGFAIQARVNMEKVTADGAIQPTAGTLGQFQVPSGPGVRVDTFGYAGLAVSPRFDSLLAKVIVHRGHADFDAVTRGLQRALDEFQIGGVETNIPFLQSLLARPEVREGAIDTRFVDERLAEIAASPPSRRRPYEAAAVDAPSAAFAGARVDRSDPLAVLQYGRSEAEKRKAGASGPASTRGPEGTAPVGAPLQGTVIDIPVGVGAEVAPGTLLAIMESMKMEHEVRAESAGVVRRLAATVGDAILQGEPILFLELREGGAAAEEAQAIGDLDEIRADLKEVLDRQGKTRDPARPEAVARRRRTNQRTARENIEHLCDPGTFFEYGSLVLAAQRQRRSIEDLIVRSPADGMIVGVGQVNGSLFPEPASGCVVMAYDYTVFAGTQGRQNHRKTDRLVDVAAEGRMPMVLFAEGGGGRPGDTDGIGGSGAQSTFGHFARLSGLVPMIGIASGRCFAGNASLLGCCDVIIATKNSNIGMGGPAMIEGGGLGVFAPEDIGPIEVQARSGVVDLVAEDEAHAVELAKHYLSFFQGRLESWEAPDQRLMRHIVPENRLRVYQVRRVIETLADVGSVLELRSGFGVGIVTALIRVEGRPVGIVANNPKHLGGAIDSDGSDKGARFMQLCDAFDIPILFLCDTPGIMVGPEIEKTGLVRHSSRMFLVGANLGVPYFTVVLRKAYGLGAVAMAGGAFKESMFIVSWPTGEFGGMGLEGHVKLGYRQELAAIEDPAERMRAYERMVAKEYEKGKALNNASLFGVDDAIDPADTRAWVAALLKSIRPGSSGPAKRRPMVDAW